LGSIETLAGRAHKKLEGNPASLIKKGKEAVTRKRGEHVSLARIGGESKIGRRRKTKVLKEGISLLSVEVGTNPSFHSNL